MEGLGQSRIEPVRFSGFGDKHEIYILRDDLIHPLVSGNKWRKLKYIVSHIREIGKNRIVTFGGAYSNHLVATAAAGKMAGIHTSAFVRGDEKREYNAFERSCLENGMELIHVSRTAYKDKEKLFTDYYGSDPGAEMVGEGGRHPSALKGCGEMLEMGGGTFDHILLSVGTCTTMEGLVKAASEKGLDTLITGISSLKGNREPDLILSAYPVKYWQMEYNYHRGSYASSDPELMDFIAQFGKETGIALEFVYTGKMMMALADMIRQGRFRDGCRILCIHTGGLPHLLPQ